MNIDLNLVSFQAKIKIIDAKTFSEKTKKLNPKKHFIGYPWAPNDIKRSKNIYTTSIMDCIAGGIVNGNNVVGFHLCTLSQKQAKQRNLRGFSITDIERRMLEKIDLTKENLHAFIIGGFQLNKDSKYNVNKLNKIMKIFEKYKIPYSIFGARRDVHYFGKFSIFYNHKEDTWFISNSLSSIDTYYENRMIVADNKISYRKYDVIKDERGCCRYPSKRLETSAEEYLKSQFRLVKLSKYDEFV